jgi:tRNA A-37 threonylcarbamoyl transferase component Bud32
MSHDPSSPRDSGGGNAGGEVEERRGAFMVWRQNTVEAKALLISLLPDPDRLLAAGVELPSPWRGPATDKVRLSIDGRDYFLKRYNCLGWFYRLKNALRPSRALRSWLAVRVFLERGVPTPEPLLCLEERHLRLLGRSYVLFPFVAAATGSFLDLWPLLNEGAKRKSLESLGGIIGAMHRKGLLHGDLNWRNILALSDEDGPHFQLVDLDGSRLLATVNARLAERDLDHFLRDLERAGSGPDLTMLFLDRWRREVGIDPS